MPKGLYADAPEHVTLHEYAEPGLGAHEVRIRSEFAAIKHGTIFHLFSGKSPFQNQRFDADLRMFVKEKQASKPGGLVGDFIGNMVVGRIVETGAEADRFNAGDRVYCYGPVSETLTLNQDQVKPLLDPMTPEDAVCLDPALFAYGAIRDTGTCLLGATVAISGLGAIGLCGVQMLHRAGCLHVVAIDPVEKRRNLAETFGADLTIDPVAEDAGMVVRDRFGAGADIVIEASGHYAALRDTLRIARQCGRIVTLGYYKSADTDLALGAEWHHNRLELISSMPEWGNPSREHPVWDLQRFRTTLIDMFRGGMLTGRGIVDPIVDFADAPQAFMDIYRNPVDSVKLGFRFPA